MSSIGLMKGTAKKEKGCDASFSALSPEIDQEGQKLSDLRAKWTDLQREITEEVWLAFVEFGEWPTARTVFSRHGTDEAHQAINELPQVLKVCGDGNNRTIQLTPFGTLTTADGTHHLRLIIRYLMFLHAKFREEPNRVTFENVEFEQNLKLSSKESMLLITLVKATHLWAGGSYGAGTKWTVDVPTIAEHLGRKRPVDHVVQWLMEQSVLQPKVAEVASVEKLASAKNEPGFEHLDPLKRRYQVFVSSTFEDLKEERQHVIQALLETKCIPTGMELFPAASLEQWELIRRVISECDYYLLILGGRYGSLHPSGTGYTEMEFDYAISTNKPILAFFHSNPDKLSADRIEKTDEGQRRYAAFLSKVKKKLCRRWTSPAELGSAVKSAILHELEYNPQPGWVRADALPAEGTIGRLKQRIADLEERLKTPRINQLDYPSGDDILRLSGQVLYDFSGEPLLSWSGNTAKGVVDISFEITWDDFFKLVEKLSGYVTDAIVKKVEQHFLPKARDHVEKLEGKHYDDLKFFISDNDVEMALNTFVARGLAKRSSGTNPGWTLTAKGLQHLATLHAVRKNRK